MISVNKKLEDLQALDGRGLTAWEAERVQEWYEIMQEDKGSLRRLSYRQCGVIADIWAKVNGPLI